MGRIRTDREHIITLSVSCSAVTLAFSEEESTGVKAVILDILTEAYRERRHVEKWIGNSSAVPYKKDVRRRHDETGLLSLQSIDQKADRQK